MRYPIRSHRARGRDGGRLQSPQSRPILQTFMITHSTTERQRQLPSYTQCFACGVCVERDRLAWWVRECAHLSKLQAAGSLTLQRGRRPHPHTNTQGPGRLASHVTTWPPGYCEEGRNLIQRRKEEEATPTATSGHTRLLWQLASIFCVRVELKVTIILAVYLYLCWVGTMTTSFFFILGTLPLVIFRHCHSLQMWRILVGQSFQKSNWCMPLWTHGVLTSVIQRSVGPNKCHQIQTMGKVGVSYAIICGNTCIICTNLSAVDLFWSVSVDTRGMFCHQWHRKHEIWEHYKVQTSLRAILQVLSHTEARYWCSVWFLRGEADVAPSNATPLLFR